VNVRRPKGEWHLKERPLPQEYSYGLTILTENVSAKVRECVGEGATGEVEESAAWSE